MEHTNVSSHQTTTLVLQVVDNSALQQPVEQRFRQLVEAWQVDCPPSSRVADIVTHPAYQQIIGLGPAAIPLLLRELETNLDHWFWALTAITGANPVPEESKGNLKKMAQAWLEWGNKYGYSRT
ncbi:MAG: hypothetical protein WAQ98_10465 [Blastocatellia bacterium]